MKISSTRHFFLLLLTFVMLFAQQAGAAHALHHALEDLTQQQDEDKQAPHSETCEKCADYAHLGNALNVSAHDFALLSVSDETLQFRTIPIRSIRTLPAVARGPPNPK